MHSEFAWDGESFCSCSHLPGEMLHIFTVRNISFLLWVQQLAAERVQRDELYRSHQEVQAKTELRHSQVR